MIRSLLAILSLLVLLSGSGWAQTGGNQYDVGWFDHRDEISKTTGLGTVLGLDRSVASHSFNLTDARTFNLADWDMVIFGSFSERAPGWDRFAGREKAKLLKWVADGGILVRMCRYHRSDRDRDRRLDIIPDDYGIFIGGDDDTDEWHASAELLSLWQGIDYKLKPRSETGDDVAWYRLPGGAYGELDHGLFGVFENWGPALAKSAGRNPKKDERVAYALHDVKYGKGQILLFQMVFDKYDGAKDELSRKLSTTFFSSLLRYGRANRNIGKRSAQPIRTEPEPRVEPKPRTEPEPKPRVEAKPEPDLPRTLRIEGRIFIDANGNGRFDAGEKPASEGLRLRDRGQSVAIDDQGRFSITRPRTASGFVQLDLWGNLSVPGGWFRFLGAETGSRRVLDLDFPIRINEAEVTRALATTLPGGLEDAAVMASVEARLIEVARKEKAGSVILFTDRSTEAELRAMRGRLERLLRADTGFQLYLAMAPDNKAVADLAPRDWTLYLGNWFLRAGDDVGSADIGIGVTNVQVTTSDQGISTPESPCLRSASNEPATGDDLIAPILLDPAQLGGEVHYLILEDGAKGQLRRLEPESSRPEPEGPKLPLHPWGKGDIGSLLEQAKEAAKD